jgi:hypothetical protein
VKTIIRLEKSGHLAELIEGPLESKKIFDAIPILMAVLGARGDYSEPPFDKWLAATSNLVKAAYPVPVPAEPTPATEPTPAEPGVSS